MVNKEKCMQMVEELRVDCGYTWNEIGPVINKETGNNLSSSAYRMAYYDWINKEAKEEIEGQITWDNGFVDTTKPIDVLSDELPIDELAELKLEKMKLADYRTQVNQMYRRMSREETARIIAQGKPFLTVTKPTRLEDLPLGILDRKAAILCISDWHYGSVQDSYYNTFNPDICKQRVDKLIDETLYRLNKLDFNKNDDLYVVNLQDLINGCIHTQTRINNRIDVITQIMEVSEMVAEMLNTFSYYFNVHYVSTMDNHSRIMPDKKDSMDLESLCRITDWYVKERCKNIEFENNIYGDDIATFNVLGHNVAAAHGDKDKPSNIIKNLTLHTRQPYDLMLSAHRHHFSADEENECVLVCNGSIMGTDDFAQSLRLNSKPSQTLIIATPENAVDTIYKINLD